MTELWVMKKYENHWARDDITLAHDDSRSEDTIEHANAERGNIAQQQPKRKY